MRAAPSDDAARAARPPADAALAARLAAVARPLLPAVPGLEGDDAERVRRDVGRALARQARLLPRWARPPFRLALAGFEWAPLLRHGHRHAALPPERQRARCLAWGRSPIGPVRDWMRLVRSCALFHYLDHPLVLARLEAAAETEAAREAGEPGTAREAREGAA